MARGRPLPVLFLTVFLDLMGFGIIIPLLPFLAEDTGASPFQVTLLVASYSLMQFLMAPVWGRVSDRIGRRPVLLVSIGGSIAGLVLFGLSTSYWMLLASRLVHGGMNANIAVAQACIADVTTRETRAKGMGVFGAAIGLGFIFGPAVGGLLGRYGFAVPAFVAAGLGVVNLFLASWRLPETRREAAPEQQVRPWRLLDVDALRVALRSRTLGVYLAVTFLFMVGFSAMESTFALWSGRALSWRELQNGVLFTYLGTLMVVVQGGLVGRLRKRVGERALATTGLLLLGLGLAGLPYAGGLPMLLLATGLLAVGNGLLVPNLSALVSFETVEGHRGSVLGLYQGVSSLGRVVGPLVGGGAFAGLGIRWPFLLGALLMVGCLGLLAQARGTSPPRLATRVDLQESSTPTPHEP